MDYDDEPVETVEVTFVTNGGKTAQVPVGSILLRGSMRADGGIPFKCCGGICGTCRCFIEEGLENTKPPTKKEAKHISAEEAAQGHRLACQTTITGPVKVSWVPLEDRPK